MDDLNHEKAQLPDGYYYPTAEEADFLHKELQRELSPGHLLYDLPVRTFAACEGTDDTLFQHIDQPERFTVVHLTWIGKTEIDTTHPTVECDGSFADFLAYDDWWRQNLPT